MNMASKRTAVSLETATGCLGMLASLRNRLARLTPSCYPSQTLTAETSCEVFLLNQHAFDRLRSSYPALGAPRLGTAKGAQSRNRWQSEGKRSTADHGALFAALSVRKMVSRYLTADSAHYVRICMREALHCCYVIALSIFVMIYITVSCGPSPRVSGHSAPSTFFLARFIRFFPGANAGSRRLTPMSGGPLLDSCPFSEARTPPEATAF